MLFLLAAGAGLVLTSCGKDKEKVDPDLLVGGMNFGKVTTTVVVVNPVINNGSSTSVSPGTVRKGVRLEVAGLPAVSTDALGLAVLNGLPTGRQALRFDNGSLDFVVENKGELYDLIVSHRDGVAYIVPIVRYPIGGDVTVLSPGDDLSAAAAEDNAVLLLREGTYTGDVVVTGENVLVFGTWHPAEGPKSVINGNLTFNGGGGRVRGLAVSGMATVNANRFSAAFSTFTDADLKGNNMVLLRNTFAGESVTVPSSSAVLVDNTGIE